ncbi:MAG: hypothetical protein ACI8UO_002571 [Verrucomicrobiales bacterium]|jgi:hypothetical protein
MNAAEIIAEIKSLPPDEVGALEEFFEERARESRRLSGEELKEMAHEMVDSDGMHEQAAMKKTITEEFYGDEGDDRARCLDGSDWPQTVSDKKVWVAWFKSLKPMMNEAEHVEWEKFRLEEKERRKKQDWERLKKVETIFD